MSDVLGHAPVLVQVGLMYGFMGVLAGCVYKALDRFHDGQPTNAIGWLLLGAVATLSSAYCAWVLRAYR